VLLGGQDNYGGHGGNGGHGGHGNGGHGGHGFYKELIDTILFRKCFPCLRVCFQRVTVQIDPKLVVKYTKTLVYTIDKAFQKHHGITLSQYVANVMKSPLPEKYNGLLQIDTSRGIKTRAAKFLVIDAIATVLPNTYQEIGQHALYKAIQPELLKFVSTGKGDLSMVAAAAVAFLLKQYQISGIDLPTVPCIICRTFNRGCTD